MASMELCVFCMNTDLIMSVCACVPSSPKAGPHSRQGLQVSPHHGKNHGNYPVSADTIEILHAQGRNGRKGRNKIWGKLPIEYKINRDFNSLKPIYIGISY